MIQEQKTLNNNMNDKIRVDIFAQKITKIVNPFNKNCTPNRKYFSKTRQDLMHKANLRLQKVRQNQGVESLYPKKC